MPRRLYAWGAAAGAAAAAVMCLAAASSAAGAARPALPTMQEIRELSDRGEDAEALKMAARALAARGEAAEGYDPQELWSIKGEAHLRRREAAAAAAAFSKAATLDGRGAGAEARRDQARATVILLSRCKALEYTPAAARGGEAAAGIEVVDPESRRAALADLYAAERAGLAAKVRAGRGARTAGPVAAAVGALADLRALEVAAAGRDGEAAVLARELAEPAAELLDNRLDAASKRLGIIERRTARVLQEDLVPDEPRPVGQLNPVGGRPDWQTARMDWYIVRRRWGLSRSDASQLRDALAVFRDVAALARRLAAAVGRNGDGESGDVRLAAELAAMATEARDSVARAEYLLEFDFSKPEVEKVIDKDDPRLQQKRRAWEARLQDQRRRRR